MVLIGDNENDLYRKFLWYVSCHYHGNERLIIKRFFFHNFSLPPNTRCRSCNTLKWICQKPVTSFLTISDIIRSSIEGSASSWRRHNHMSKWCSTSKLKESKERTHNHISNCKIWMILAPREFYILCNYSDCYNKNTNDWTWTNFFLSFIDIFTYFIVIFLDDGLHLNITQNFELSWCFGCKN